MSPNRRLLVAFIILISWNFISLASERTKLQMRDESLGERIAEAKMVSPGVGWAVVMKDWSCAPGGTDASCAHEKLYWTNDDGGHWRDITPATMPSRHITNVFFLDGAHGWIVAY